MLIDDNLLDKVTEQAKASDRLESKAQRLLIFEVKDGPFAPLGEEDELK